MTSPLRREPIPDDTTILVVAAHALVREGLRSVLRETAGLRVVAEAADAAAAASLVARVKPDVVLLERAPSDAEASTAVAALRRASPTTCVVSLSGDSALGTSDVVCVPPSAGVTELCSVLGDALGGRCAACALRTQCAVPQIAIALSRRERQVAVCVARGMSSKQIAGALGIALRTVNTYRESLARKLGASSAAVVTRFVLEANLDGPGPQAV